MAKKRKNQPGYRLALARDGRHYWQPINEKRDKPTLPSSVPAGVEIEFRNREQIDDLSKQLFGRTFEPHEYAAIMATPPGSRVLVDELPGIIRIYVDHPYYRDNQSCWLEKKGDDRILKTVLFSTNDKAPKGFGRTIFVRQVHNAQKLGFTKMQCLAERNDKGGYFGYYLWPLLGYNAKLEPSEQEKIYADTGFRPTDMHEVIANDVTREWWRVNGDSKIMEFDLRPGSKSLEILSAYLAEREDLKSLSELLAKATATFLEAHDVVSLANTGASPKVRDYGLDWDDIVPYAIAAIRNLAKRWAREKGG